MLSGKNCHCLVRYERTKEEEKRKAVGSFETWGSNNTATKCNNQKDSNHHHQNEKKNYKLKKADGLEVYKAICM